MRTATASAATVAAIAAIFASTQAAIKPLIMGGTVVPIGEATFVTGIRNATTAQTFCGGSLIHPKWVLTAAHCAGCTDFVNVGTHYNSGATDGNIVKVVNNITHPGYYMLSAGFDFLLLELEKEVTSVTPVALAKADGSDEAGGQFATVYGWGTTEWLGTNSKELLSVDVEIHDQSECKKVFNVTDTMLCAGGERNKDACNGDSGGPLVVTRDGTPTLVGVVSWGTGCGWEGYPGVYARVSKVRDFIDHYVPAVRWL